MRFLAVALFVASFSSCNSCGDPKLASTEGVGWTVDVPGFSLVEGRVFSTPAGQEESFISALAGLTVEWVRACAAEPAAPAGSAVDTTAVEAAKMRLVLLVRRDGRVATASTADSDQLAQCVAARAKGQSLAVSKPASTDTWLQIGLRLARRVPDGAAQPGERPRTKW